MQGVPSYVGKLAGASVSSASESEELDALDESDRLPSLASRSPLGVARGEVSPGSADADHMVDGISGATRTSQGVHGLLRFWLGDLGFGPYLERIRQGKG